MNSHSSKPRLSARPGTKRKAEKVRRCGLRVEVFTGTLSGTQFGEHISLALVRCPSWAELKMRFVLDRLPVAAPFEAELDAQCTYRFVFRRLVQVFCTFENSNIEG